jgi:hypothetical protein
MPSWQRLLEDGKYGSAAELAEAEKVNASYLSRILRLTLLSPRVVGAILAGNQHKHVSLQNLLAGFPSSWDEQKSLYLTS